MLKESREKEERKERSEKGEGVGGGGLHSSTLPLVRGFLDERGPAEREGRWRVEERRGMEGRGGAGLQLHRSPTREPDRQSESEMGSPSPSRHGLARLKVRRSSHSLATDMFEQHLGAHLLQVTTTAPTPTFFFFNDYYDIICPDDIAGCQRMPPFALTDEWSLRGILGQEGCRDDRNKDSEEV
ncbi:hypothetical protein FQN60_005164 [Etheostoma spectabile]|uniref:Uncharacterized protein n=1 Tax=Etheostoma spectabile TaxID=54343 RepID=A0A5J5DM47_9PERO|nr:hypothetical protein FQN60_005164 [Etheostoma spectabile]